MPAPVTFRNRSAPGVSVALKVRFSRTAFGGLFGSPLIFAGEIRSRISIPSTAMVCVATSEVQDALSCSSAVNIVPAGACDFRSAASTV
jgi:hypothetical protein